ncbi:MAG: Z1 domain-containing protein [Luteimonas sp.]
MATVEILNAVRPDLRWTPVEGSDSIAFRERKAFEIKNAEELERVLFEAQTILGRCVPPSHSSGDETGLVVGYVQSGKTLSFTAVMALARDNGYRLVILIAGIGNNLKDQSERRLLADLGLESGNHAWAHFPNPNPSQDDATNIENALDAWSRPNVPANRRRTVLITVLKNHTRLRNLVTVLGRLKLAQVPTLVIDDEADQASLNTKAASNKKKGVQESSATYDWITQLKQALPHHTFIQYTATPQANLLLHLADGLSPSFAELVTPGEAYVGGREFFAGSPSLVVTIPAKEIPPTYAGAATPESLQSALRFYLLGAAVHYMTGQKGHRSMMVHPSQYTGPHADYKAWVGDSIRSWRDLLEQPEDSSGFQACAGLFGKEYRLLQGSFPTIPPLNDLLRVMSQVIGETRIQQVNSSKVGEKTVKWNASDYWVLIGGQKLDRGFTVEGLTTTYMPRSLGTGNADTIQQRARFFGYKRSYLGLCRFFFR